jgi:hypothetical protein
MCTATKKEKKYIYLPCRMIVFCWVLCYSIMLKMNCMLILVFLLIITPYEMSSLDVCIRVCSVGPWWNWMPWFTETIPILSFKVMYILCQLWNCRTDFHEAWYWWIYQNLLTHFNLVKLIQQLLTFWMKIQLHFCT